MSETSHRKKLIEVSLPLFGINANSSREKSIRHGHPSTLHLWWAPRPLAACRAVIFAQLVDDPSAWPERFPSREAQTQERERLFRILVGTKEKNYRDGLVAWESSTDDKVLYAARYEIARSLAWGRGEEPPSTQREVLNYIARNAPAVYDPFCGRGLIPLEAQRLGLRAYGSDLNPVAVLISKALVELPQRFAHGQPVNPGERGTASSLEQENEQCGYALAQDVRYYGEWVSKKAKERIGHLYPSVEVGEEACRQQPALSQFRGARLSVIGWLWVRTVVSPNPAAKGVHVPLVSSFMLCAKPKRKAWVEPVVDSATRTGFRFEVHSGSLSQEEEALKKQGTKVGRASFRCLLTDAPISAKYVKAEGKAGRFGWRLMAIIADGGKGRVYLPPNEEHERLAFTVEPEDRPDIPLSTHPQYMSVTNYGPSVVGDLFMDRQTHALNVFSELVTEVRDQIKNDALHAGVENSDVSLNEGGSGDQAYADAVATYLGLSVSKLANRQSTNTFWHTTRETIEQVFAMQALPMRWDTVEGNPFSTSSGNFIGQLNYLANVVQRSPNDVLPVSVKQADAQHADLSGVLVATDPPYFDNVPYADLSDFFYPWLRKTLRPIFPDLFATISVPKREELVADSRRHGSPEAAERFFLEGMSSVLRNVAKETPETNPVTLFYAFRQSEKGEIGASSTGWAAFLEAVVDAGLMVDGTWPIKTELTGNLKKKWNALASSIVLACRKRSSDALVTTRAEFMRNLRRELPSAIRILQEGNIAPVDLAQAAIGPGMAIFSRYTQVLEADDSRMSIKVALALINAELDAFLSEQEAEYDEWTRFAITWFETYGLQVAAYDAAETLARAKGISVEGLKHSGLIEAHHGKVRLRRRDELSANWSPSQDGRVVVWEGTQQLIRRLEHDGEQGAASLLAQLGVHSELARDLAYRLFGVCEEKAWTEEARAYNSLVVVWPELTKLAHGFRLTAGQQAELEL